jgi:trimeric autotransporter adhesin
MHRFYPVFLMLWVCHFLKAQPICNTCTEPNTSFSDASLIQCENFDAYTSTTLPSTATNWGLYRSGATRPRIQASTAQAGRELTLNRANGQSEALYKLGNRTRGRWRLSFRLRLTPNKHGYFAVHHTDGSSPNGNPAYHLFFRNGDYELVLGKADGPAFVRKRIPSEGSFMNIVQIIDLDADRAELFIKDQFIYAWKFSTGASSPSKTLGALFFETIDNADFQIDNICLRSNANATANTIFAPVCSASGINFNNKSAATNLGLYADVEILTNCETVKCASCIEEEGTFQNVDLLQCENFDNSSLGVFTFNYPSTNWKPFRATGGVFALTESQAAGAGLQLRMIGSTGSQPDGQYLLGNRTAGRYRISFKVEVNPGSVAYFDLQHNQDGNANQNRAYDVRFGANGQGGVYLRASNTVADTFFYKQGQPTKVMNIIDLNTDLAELWINDRFIFSWRFSQGSRRDEKVLGALSFWAQAGANFAVDNICVLKRSQGYRLYAGSPVCIKNGSVAGSDSEAREYLLYTPNEFATPCNPQKLSPNACDYGESVFNINGTTVKGRLGLDDRLPANILKEYCIDREWSSTDPSRIYGKVLIYKHDGTQGLALVARSSNRKNVYHYMIACDCKNPSGGCASNCVPGGRTDETGIKDYPELPKGTYQIVILATDTIGYSIYASSCEDIFRRPEAQDNPKPQLRGDDDPCAVCQTANPALLTCGQTLNATLRGQTNNYCTVRGPNSNPYKTCYNGSRNYEGEDTQYKFTLSEASVVSFILEQTATAMGLFLYDFQCAVNCMASAESSGANGRAVIGPLRLPPGEYHLIVDEAALNGSSGNFSLKIECENDQDPQFYNAGSAACPIELNNKQQIRLDLNSSSTVDGLPLRVGDKINFFYPKNGLLAFANGKIWNGRLLSFDLYADRTGDAEKCGFAPGDAFALKVTRRDQTWDISPSFQPPGGEINGGNAFQINSISGISRVQGSRAPNRLAVFPPLIQSTNLGGAVELNVVANIAWQALGFQAGAPARFVKITSSSGAGNADLGLTIDPNPFAQMRRDTLRFIGPNNEFRRVLVTQQGCTGATANLGRDTAICQGGGLVLTARSEANSSFKWSTGATTSSIPISNLQAQSTFSVSVTKGGCTAIDEITIRTLAPPTVDAGKDLFLDCQTQRAQLAGALSNAGAAPQITWEAPASGIVSGGSSLMPLVRLAGIYTLQITDPQSKCSARDQVQVREAPRVDASVASLGTIKCNKDRNGAIRLNVQGGTQPFTYRWTNGATTAELQNLGAGTYTLSLTDANNCQDTVNVILREPGPLSLTAQNLKAACFGQNTGGVSFLAEGGTPIYRYNWSNGSTSNALQNVAGGTYTITLSDANNCALGREVIIPASPAIRLDSIKMRAGTSPGNVGSIFVAVRGGSPPFMYVWRSASGILSRNKDAINVPYGDYVLDVTDANGCLFTSQTIRLNATTPSQNLLPENSVVIFPNPSNGELHVQLSLPQSTAVNLDLYDQQGKKLQQWRRETLQKETLKLDLQYLPAGAYWLQVLAEGKMAWRQVVMER